MNSTENVSLAVYDTDRLLDVKPVGEQAADMLRRIRRNGWRKGAMYRGGSVCLRGARECEFVSGIAITELAGREDVRSLYRAIADAAEEQFPGRIDAVIADTNRDRLLAYPYMVSALRKEDLAVWELVVMFNDAPDTVQADVEMILEKVIANV